MSNAELIDVRKNLCELVVDKLDFSKEISESEMYSEIDSSIMDYPNRNQLSLDEVIRLRKDIFNSLKRYDVIQDYLEDESITEIMINGPKNIFIETKGVLRKTEREFESQEKLEDIIQQIVAGCNRTVNEASPIQDARLLSGERVNIVLPPIALNGPIVTIRRFPSNPITMERLIELEALTKEAADFLKKIVCSKYNIFISGGTGTGKTTFLNALSQFIPSEERIITIEDSAELQLQDAQNLVRLETRSKNSEGCVPIDISDLIRSSLRMRPDRIIVGEIRGKEAIDMLQAMNTGHDGSLSTGHGNTAQDMISRLETMVMSGMDIPLTAIRGQIESGIDIFIHLGRLRDKKRVVLEISETQKDRENGISLNRLFEWNGSSLVKVGKMKKNRKLKDWEAANGL